MTPPAPRALRVLALTLCLALPLSGCASTGATSLPAPSETELDWTPPPDETAAQIPSQSPTEIIPAALAPYIGRIPRFDPAPTPVPVALPHYAGQAALVNEIPTTHPVAFLTIDDGAIRHPLALDLIRAANIPVTLFLTTNYVSQYQDWFRNLRDAGRVTIESHTISHPHLPQLGYGDQRYQLCGATDNLEKWYGIRPTLFRPPYGEYNGDTLRAAWSCGLKAGFHWRETVDAGNVYYQRQDKKIHAGDIVLMHFRPAFPDDFLAALTAMKEAGLTPALLEDYVALAPAGAPPPAPVQPTTQQPPPQPDPTPAPTIAPSP